MIALIVQSPWVGLGAFVGVSVNTVTAIVLRIDETFIKDGLYGYNGTLVGGKFHWNKITGNLM